MIRKHYILGLCLVMLFGIAGIGVLSLTDTSQRDTIYLNNVGATKCWKGTCGHKSKSYTYPAYVTSGRSTKYHHGGTYLDPGAQEEVSISVTAEQSMNKSGEVDAKVAKASVGFTGGANVSLSRTQILTNKKSYRRYPHLGVEYANRYNTVTIKKRTYDPGWHLTATDKYCKFTTKKAKQSCKVVVAVGISLRDTISK